jgi:hypothetical protein
LKGATSLANVGGAIRTRDFIDPLVVEGIDFVFDRGKGVLDSFGRFKYGIDVLFSKDFGDFIGGTFDERKKGLGDVSLRGGFGYGFVYFLEGFRDLKVGIAIIGEGHS